MTNPDRRESLAWMVAGAVVVVGVVATVVGLLTPVTFGWFAYQPLADATFVPGGDHVILSRTTAIGFVVVALGLLALAFLCGRRFARR
ncbi:MAG TPA: hypothetical protein VFY91_15735 [Microbacterium sp.]|nr:hypothetical protein [Microbacterium sp.]